MASQHESRPQARLVRSPRLLVRVRLEHGTWRRVPIPGSCQTRLGKPSFNRYNQSTTFTGPVLLGMFAASKTNMAWRGQLDCAENCNIVRISRVGSSAPSASSQPELPRTARTPAQSWPRASSSSKLCDALARDCGASMAPYLAAHEAYLLAYTP
jgi:hypothetical protein